MTVLRRPRVVLLGMLSRIPVGGVAWLVGQYALGFDRLGFETYYVEAHSRTPTMFMRDDRDQDVGRAFKEAARFVAMVMKHFGLERQWALQALQDDVHSYGLSRTEVADLYRDAVLIINLHGGTLPLIEHAETGRLVYMGTDPVELELELDSGYQPAIDFMAAHSGYFTWALNYGNPDCRLPWSAEFPMVPCPPPVITGIWESDLGRDGSPFTTVGNWRQDWRNVTFEGETYYWSKHREFLKVLSLPSEVDSSLELALGCYEEADRALLETNGWRVRPASEVSGDISAYRDYILSSRGEFTVAKDQNVRLRSGWFSERSATYLAAGRPVVVQDTGFANTLPVGEGLLAFDGLEDAAEALQEIDGNYERHSKAAVEIAREHFGYEVVLGGLLDRMGIARPRGACRQARAGQDLPRSLALTPTARHPLSLLPETVEKVLARPVPLLSTPGDDPVASLIIVTLNNLALTRMAIESIITNTRSPDYELIVVDNGSGDGTQRYLSVLAARNRNVRVVYNEENNGFAAANNQGLALARGQVIFLLNNDVIAPPGWLSGLIAHLQDPSIGLVGPVTNRCGNEAEVLSSYSTYGDMLDFAATRRILSTSSVRELPVAVMFCVGFRRETLDAVGLLDERYELGMFEDDDYALRVRQAGKRVVCAEDVFVHHFGEASLGWLAAAGRYGDLFEANQRRFEEKWGMEWRPHGRRRHPAYERLRGQIVDAIGANIPAGSAVLVVTRGDDLLVELPGHDGWHFPGMPDGTYAGHYPASDAQAVDELERLRRRGAMYLVIPAPALWWLEHYEGLRRHLETHYRSLLSDPETAVMYDLRDVEVA